MMQMMAYNKNYKRDVKYLMLLIPNILLGLGVRPFSDGGRSTCKKICRILTIFISYTLLFCCLVPGIFYWMVEKRLRARIKMTTILFYGCVTCIKYGDLIIRQDQVRRCFQCIEEDWKKAIGGNTRLTMLEYARNGRRLIAISATFFYSSGLSLRAFLPLAKGKIVNEYNITIKPLPYPTFLFSLNVYASPVYEVLYAIQCLCGVVTNTISTAMCGLLIIFVMHACGQMKILMDSIKSFVEWQEESEMDKRLADIVEHQVRIRSFLQLTDHTLRQMCLVEISGITVLICVLGYCIIMEWENSNSFAMCSYFVTFSTTVVVLLILCYIGEQLIIQAETVAATVSELEWYRLPDRNARGVILVMMMSNTPFKITAGKIFDLSFKTFGNILKTAMAYFNMLRNVTQ